MRRMLCVTVLALSLLGCDAASRAQASVESSEVVSGAVTVAADTALVGAGYLEAPGSNDALDLLDSLDVLGSGDVLDRLVEWGTSTWDTVSGVAEEQVEARRSAVPQHFALGEEAVATENLSVMVVSVEEGPYDYLDRTSTVRVVVRMRNTSDHVVTVKASNWDADSASGEREDHKYVVLDQDNHVVASSFTVARISPGRTFEAEVYFDGSGLVSVIYEPHWLISSENEYLYFDL